MATTKDITKKIEKVRNYVENYKTAKAMIRKAQSDQDYKNAIKAKGKASRAMVKSVTSLATEIGFELNGCYIDNDFVYIFDEIVAKA